MYFNFKIFFDHIEKKYAEKLDDRKRELQLKHEKVHYSYQNATIISPLTNHKSY
jgi:hypothetical protein